jgi:uncharacterized protein YdiU (UPF0061 family)
MPTDPAYRPDPVYEALNLSVDRALADEVTPADFPQTTLRHRNDRAAKSVGLAGLTEAEWIAAFGRFEPLADNQRKPLAMRYHGHQFRSYNPQLGDGRGFLFGQVREADTNRLLDFGTKGSGRTPWSRTADGRLTLKGGVREILAATMLEAQGVPTSRAFSLIETGEDLIRGDEPSPTRSSVLTRLSHSHIRFGSFQRWAYHERPDLITALLDHVTEVYHPAAQGPAGVLTAIVQATAHLCARWMAAGFVHGVLNTDNLNVTGESFDYGPWRFLPRSDPGFTAAYFDETGLYAFARQPEAVFWNLQQLAAALTTVSPPEPLIDALNTFEAAYSQALTTAMLDRLALTPRSREEDVAMVTATFRALSAGGDALRWEPLFFDWFGGKASEGRAMAGPRAGLYATEPFAEFRRLISAYEPVQPERLAAGYFQNPDPEEMLIEEVEALWAPIAETDDWSPLRAKLARLETMRSAIMLT